MDRHFGSYPPSLRKPYIDFRICPISKPENLYCHWSICVVTCFVWQPSPASLHSPISISLFSRNLQPYSSFWGMSRMPAKTMFWEVPITPYIFPKGYAIALSYFLCDTLPKHLIDTPNDVLITGLATILFFLHLNNCSIGVSELLCLKNSEERVT